MKIIAEPTSSNFSWGIYGLTPKVGCEDIRLYNEEGEQIAFLCLNAKRYLRVGLEDLKGKPEEIEFINALENYLKDNQIYYWYYYDELGDEDFYEVSFEAPKNSEGVKPRSIEIWHYSEDIGIDTIKSAITEFAKKFLGIEDCIVQVEVEDYETSLETFREHERLFGGENPVEICFSEEIILELSHLWEMTEDEVLTKLKKSIR